ncbi:MAG TPA: hypothetical protein VJ696_05320, partial [Rhodanobacteraceae bacterium]|nr:hypothetical protein [Rhodanobacteraceae bacterium]
MALVIELGEQMGFAPEIRQTDPGVQRSLRVYALDAMLRRSAGQIGSLSIPFEVLGGKFNSARFKLGTKPGPFGSQPLSLVNLDDPALVAQGGMKPDNANPQFAQQMVYAAASWTLDRFRTALGREPDYMSGRKLRLEPFGHSGKPSEYQPREHCVSFQWEDSSPHTRGAMQNDSLMLWALSHDTIVHEVSHAFIFGVLRHCRFGLSKEVGYIGESYCDLIALFAHFSHEALVREAVEDRQGLLDQRFSGYGWQAGLHENGKPPLRKSWLTWIRPFSEKPAALDYGKAEGTQFQDILTCAVFEAFYTVYTQKTERWQRLIKAQPGLRWDEAIIAAQVKEAQQIAGQFLNIVIRSLDYLPPLDLNLGDVLRAMVTADMDMVPEDRWNYRESLIYAFRRYGVPVDGVGTLGENALRWSGDVNGVLNKNALLGLTRLPLVGAAAISVATRTERGNIVEQFLNHNAPNLAVLGLDGNADAQFPIRIETAHSVARVGPHGRLVINHVVQITQGKITPAQYVMLGGCTLVVDGEGELRFVIRKDLQRPDYEKTLEAFLDGEGSRYEPAYRKDNW